MSPTTLCRALPLLAALLPTIAVAQSPAQPSAPVAAAPSTAPGAAPTDAPAQPPPPEAVAPSEVVAPAFDLLPHSDVGAGGLTAADVAARAVQSAPSVHAANATLTNASRRSDRAYSVFVPRLDLTASYRRINKIDMPPMLAAFTPPVDNYSLRASLRIQASDYFLTLQDYYDSAKQYELVAEHQRAAEAQAIAYQARVEYYQLARAVIASTLSGHRIAQLERFVDEIRVLVEGGEIGSVNLGQAQVRLATAQAMAKSDVATLHTAEQALRRRLDLEGDAPVGIAEPLTSGVPQLPKDLAGLIAEAQARRPEAKALGALVAARTHTREALANERYPHLAVVGDINTDNPNQRYFPLQQKFKTTWSVGVQVAWSPSDLATQNDSLDDARLEVVKAQQDLRALRDRIALEVGTAYENAHAAGGTVETLEASVQAAEQTLRIRTALFRSGEATSREVLDAELDLRQAQLQWADAILSTHLALAALDHATGVAAP